MQQVAERLKQKARQASEAADAAAEEERVAQQQYQLRLGLNAQLALRARVFRPMSGLFSMIDGNALSRHLQDSRCQASALHVAHGTASEG